jgi:hypothetical protein
VKQVLHVVSLAPTVYSCGLFKGSSPTRLVHK